MILLSQIRLLILRKKYNGYQDNKNQEEYIKWCNLWLGEMVRITKQSGSIFVHNIPKWLTFYAQELNQIANLSIGLHGKLQQHPWVKAFSPRTMGFYTMKKKQKPANIMKFVTLIKDVVNVDTCFRTMGARNYNCIHLDL